MTVREFLEEREHNILSAYAAKSSAAVRSIPEENCCYRTAYQRDRDRIIHSKAFRRLKHKTQVYIAPGDHYRTRMTHSLEVSQISRTIARALLLNEDLTEAISLGHDVGHTPFGHSGEEALQQVLGHFKHNEQSIRVVECLERNGKGLNLTKAVLEGILNHTGADNAVCLEGNIVKTADRIAYLCHDYDDGCRAGLITEAMLPSTVQKIFGKTTSQMITIMVADMINQSANKSYITMSEEITLAMAEFRQFMFEKIYHSINLEEDRMKAQFIVETLYHYFMKRPEKLPAEFLEREERYGLKTTVVDYIAGLTDLYAINLFENIFIPAKGVAK